MVQSTRLAIVEGSSSLSLFPHPCSVAECISAKGLDAKYFTTNNKSIQMVKCYHVLAGFLQRGLDHTRLSPLTDFYRLRCIRATLSQANRNLKQHALKASSMDYLED